MAEGFKPSSKKHHYVPQFLLRRFSHDGGKSIHAYDTRDKKHFTTNIENIAHQNHFHEFDWGEYVVSIEEWLASVEAMVAPSFESLLARDTLADFAPMDAAAICHLAGLQFVRTKAFRTRVQSAMDMMASSLEKKMAATGLEFSPSPSLMRLEGAELQEFACRQILSAPQQFAEHFATKAWVLLATTPDHPFLIGDNPLALHNSQTFPLQGNLGLAVEGIEIYLPLSPVRSLCFLCHSHMRNPRIAQHSRDGTPLALLAGDVDGINAIQVLNADRFLFSSKADFAIVDVVTGGRQAGQCGPIFDCG